ncbi:MAG: CCA tRNA nucleotidyltransferase [Patescibacteria group bacterium]|jgi:putative nucleotidyltransferase with HDIG domain
MNIQLPNKALKLINFFNNHGFECFVVGGFIRDTLLKRTHGNHSLDFATNARPEQIVELLPSSRYENAFGTVIIPLKDTNVLLGLKTSDFAQEDFFEVTTYRSEQGYNDKRHPDVVLWGKTITDDVSRRDFTINALAYDGKTFVDEYKGIDDIEKKLIKTVRDPSERFGEDALRMLRAVRLASELGFTIDTPTLEAVKINAQKLRFISKERIRDEFLKILVSPHPGEGIMILKETGLLKEFLPELLDCFTVSQVSPKRHHIYDVGTHLVKTLEACTNSDPIVRLACLLHDIGKPKTHAVQDDGVVTFYNHEITGTQIAYEIGERLHLSKKELVKLSTLVRYHQFLVSEEQTDSAIRRFIRQVGKENLKDMIDLRVADRIGSGSKPTSWRLDLFLRRIEEVQKEPFSVKDLKVNGYDVMKIRKLKPSRQIGDILDAIFELVVNGKLKNEREELVTYLEENKS